MSIATEIQRLKTAKSDLKTAIEEKGVIVGDGLIDTYADKVRKISVSKINEEYLVEEIVSGTGYVVAENVLGISHPIDVKLTSDTITDFSGITISRSGRNLIRYPYFDGNLTKEGVTFTDKGNGIVNISGTPTVKDVSYTFAKNFPLKKGTYTFSFNCSGNHNNTFIFYVYDDYNSRLININCSGEKPTVRSGTFTIDEDVENARVYVLVKLQNTTLNADVSVQLEYGTEATPYELFTDYSTHQVNADGTVDGLMSICPTTVLCADDDTVNISMAYYKNEGNGEESDDRYDEGYEDGKNSMPDLSKCASTFCFKSSEGLPENFTFNAVYQTNFSDFWSSFVNNTVKHFTLNCTLKPVRFSRFFNKPGNNTTDILEHITINADTSNVEYYNQAFYELKNLKIIDGSPLDFSSALDIRNWCTSPKVEEFRVVKESIKASFTVPLLL